ncbi:hypothetical protein [Paenibacillus agricola]|uniref:Uncharacterized protein n=1 Tax=Paenibacillus agricola TaxID=2716264 RepID=A0ABX0JG57_9BACL|nr:hypothetical protein [Paenibacillus agricola]NHN34518.1 hypothetical protein [Paenibacillus agricola]
MSYDEAAYSIDADEEVKDRESNDLIIGLLTYTKTLESMVLELRKAVNALTPQGQEQPFPDLHTDIYEAFDDHPAYERYVVL